MSCRTRLVLSRQPALSSGSSPTGRRPRAQQVACLAVAADESAFASPATIGRTEYVAETLLPTRNGKYRLRGYRHTVDDGVSWTEPTAIIFGKPEGGQEDMFSMWQDKILKLQFSALHPRVMICAAVLGKGDIHTSGAAYRCPLEYTTLALHQLKLSLEYIRDRSPGLVIYLQQEGRGIGLANKIAAYALQEKGFDTVDANRQLGLPDDAREYTSVRNILADLNISSIQLITNNPRKIRLLEALGVLVAGRIPCLVKPGEYSSAYLEAKGRRMDHLDLDGSWCYWDHSGEKDPPHPPKPVDEQTF